MNKKESYENWFIDHNYADEMTVKRLDTLMYIAYSWSLFILNDPEVVVTDNKVDVTKIKNKLFNSTFIADFWGAVDTELYNRYYKVYGLGKIEPLKQADKITNPDVLDFLNKINIVYGKESTSNLLNYVHHDYPWLEGRGKLKPLDKGYNIISNSSMYITSYKKYLTYLNSRR